MNAVVLANFPIAFLILAAIVGIPMWLTFRHPDRSPQVPAAHVPAAGMTAGRLPAAPRVSAARQHMAARTAVPGRQHAVTAGTVRGHAAASVRGGQAAAPHDHAAA
jgi:hypothetical protein